MWGPRVNAKEGGLVTGLEQDTGPPGKGLQIGTIPGELTGGPTASSPAAKQILILCESSFPAVTLWSSSILYHIYANQKPAKII